MDACSTDPAKPCDGIRKPGCAYPPEEVQMKQLVNFYDPYVQGKNADGRTLDFILSQDNDWCETTHNYIQWLFPIRSKSRFNKTAPVVNDQTLLYMCEHTRFREQIRLSFIRIMWFWGFSVTYNGGKPEVKYRDDSPDASRWCKNRDHNQLRISRMLQSLVLFGLVLEATTAYNSFIAVNNTWGGEVNADSVSQWATALQPKAR